MASASLPAPVGGWDTENALADMPVENAIALDNWFPETDRVRLRRGSASFATGMSGAVETIMDYTALSGVSKAFAAAGGNIYDASASGAVGAAAVSGLSNNRWQHVNIGTAGGQFLFAVNGADTPRLYDGSSWSTASITGPTAASLIWCNLHQRRVWFGQSASLSAWYLAVNSISGAATEFSLAGIAKLGGYIMAMGTWTRDAGDGSDDVAVFLTSEGEAIVYAGTDPSSASTWSLIGVFRVGRPIGRRCMLKAGGDLLMITQDGLVPMSATLTRDRSQAQLVSLSRQINKAMNDSVRTYGSNFGWQPVLYPKGTMMLVNVPSSPNAVQYAFNTLTGAPCRFTGMNAQCWGLVGDALYFGTTDGKTMLFDSGTSDNGTAIAGDALQAFSYFRTPGTVKAFKRAEPIFTSDGNPAVALDLNVDFKLTNTTANPVTMTSNAGLWDSATWDNGLWGGADQIYRAWRGVRGSGTAAALRVRISTTTARPSWIATNFTYIPGGQI